MRRGADRLYFPLLFALTITIAILVYRQITAPMLPLGNSVLEPWLWHDVFGLILFGFSLLLLVWQVSFALRYKPFARVPSAQFPSLTVVIPAFNEGSQILDTVRSIMASDYPRELLQDLGNIHFVHLLEDPEKVIRAVAAYLEIEIDEAMIPGILERISFGSMKKNFMKIMPESSELWKGGGDRFMNKGTNGRWRGVLTAEELGQYDRAVEKGLTADAAHWLEHGGPV